MQKPEEYRDRWVLGLSVFLTAVIFVSFLSYKGYLGFNNKKSSQTADVISAENIPSPIQNAQKTFGTAFGEIDKKYQELKDSLSAVFVPFITGIEVYDRGQKIKSKY